MLRNTLLARFLWAYLITSVKRLNVSIMLIIKVSLIKMNISAGQTKRCRDCQSQRGRKREMEKEKTYTKETAENFYC